MALHKVNGYIAITCYLALFAISLSGEGVTFRAAAAWTAGLAVHMFKILLSRKGLAVRYGGYMGVLLLMTWLVVIFTHLPGG